jgi:hypothetical protein
MTSMLGSWSRILGVNELAKEGDGYGEDQLR